MKALPRVFLQATPQTQSQRRRRLRRKRGPVGLALDHVREDVGEPVAAERLGAGQHLVDDAPEGPDVRACVDGPPARLFGAHVRRRPQQGAVDRGVRGGRGDVRGAGTAHCADGTGESEVEHLDAECWRFWLVLLYAEVRTALGNRQSAIGNLQWQTHRQSTIPIGNG